MYYLYRHISADTGNPFYIGIGKVVHSYGLDRTRYARAYNKGRRHRHWKGFVKKHGYEVEIMYEIDDENLIRQKEVEFIKLYGRVDIKTGILINKTDGGQGGYSDEYKSNMSAIHKGKTVSAETRLLISKSQLGRKLPESHRVAISASKIGKPLPAATLLASSQKRKKSVCQLDEHGNLIKWWEFIIEASKSLKIDRSDITRCCQSKIKTAGGYKWSYMSEIEYNEYQKQKL